MSGFRKKQVLCRSHRRRLRRKKSERRGAAAVEFAIVAPIMFLLVMGMFELGRAMSIQQVLTNAAREGAREAILIGSTEDSVSEVVTNYTEAASITLPEGQPAISPSLDTIEAGDTVTVSVRADFSPLSIFGGNWLGDRYTLSASSSMRKEGFE
ncbi:MAG: pilus assembly protein [Planctomycetales bacterium]|nr:pilus assembly protein [Planctomycetales bacterium]